MATDQLASPKDAIPPPPSALSSSEFRNEVLTFDPCPDPDCILVSLDGAEFRSNKRLLGSISGVFSDMLDVGPSPPESESKDIASPEPSIPSEPPTLECIELVETSHVISLLLTIAHSSPSPLPERERRKFQVGKSEADPRTAYMYGGKSPPEALLPFEHVRELIHPLGQKYQLASTVLEALRTHLGWHTPAYPLQVYALAAELAEGALTLLPPSTSPAPAPATTSSIELAPGMEKQYWSMVASDASQYLLTPTLTTLPLSHSRQFPTAESYAALLTLQLFRIDALRSILRDNEKTIVFPFDYGICKDHGLITRKMWDRQKMALEDQLDAGTDVAEAMGTICEPAVRHCSVCAKGVNAAVEMLRVRIVDAFEPDEEEDDSP